MPTQKLSQLIADLDCIVQGDSSVLADHISFDSRTIRQGGLFVALKGKDHNGHDYVQRAFERGAIAALVETDIEPSTGKTCVQVKNSRAALAQVAAAFYGYPTKQLRTVGITGTKGKTTTAHLCEAVLNNALCLSTVTNASLPKENTTPESLDVQRMASEGLDQGLQNLILEISAHGLVHHRVDGVDIDAAIFTNLSQDHFDDFEGFNDYFATKARLFTELEPRISIINLDDAYGRRLIRQATSPIWSYGLSPAADFSAEISTSTPAASVFKVNTPQGSIEMTLQLPGEFNISNALAAVAVGVWHGLDLDTIKTRLEGVRSVSGRFERLVTPDGVDVVVDFAHSPDSLEKIILFLKQHYKHVITVFGCGGESDPYKRPIMGNISGRLSDHIILTHDNPKRENPQKILDQIEQGLSKVSNCYDVISYRPDAIRHALSMAQTGDCVLVAGKGHETTQIFADEVIDFNDTDFLIQECGATPKTSTVEPLLG